jgi:hypothetical protein
MLNVLAGGIPEGDELLVSLLRDPELGPVALLVQKRDRDPDEVSAEEAAWLMAGSILELLEIGVRMRCGHSSKSCHAPSGWMWSAPCATPAIRHAER